MTHLAFNLATGEILTTNHGNHLKRWVARHSANDIAWGLKWGEPIKFQWVFAHGKDYTDCVAKLTKRLKFPS